jgi:hypothetical protein
MDERSCAGFAASWLGSPMTRYIWRSGHFIDRMTGEPMLTGEPPTSSGAIVCPSVMPDLPAYASPLGDGMIEGRSARREHLKRNGCRELDPSEFKPSYQSKADRAARAAAQQRMLAERS